MRSLDRLQAQPSFGSRAIGHRRVTITSGSGDIGSIPRLKGHAGRIRTTTTIAKAGSRTEDIGTTRTTTTAIGATMIKGGAIASTRTATNAPARRLGLG